MHLPPPSLLNFPTGYRCNLICHEQLVPRSCRSYTKSSWHKSWVDKYYHVLRCVTLKGRLFAIGLITTNLLLCLCGWCGKSCSKKEKRTQKFSFKIVTLTPPTILGAEAAYIILCSSRKLDLSALYTSHPISLHLCKFVYNLFGM